MFFYLPDQKRNLTSLPAVERDGALLRSLGFYGYFGTTYYTQAGSQAVALR